MIRFEVKNRFSGEVQFTAEIDCSEDAPISLKLGLAVKWAVKTGVDLAFANLARADLTDADLRQANFRGANLARANFRGANLTDANLMYANLRGAIGRNGKLVGRFPIFQIGPIGSRRAVLTAENTESGIYVYTGCYNGLIDDFEEKVKNEHGENNHARDYAAAITLTRSRFEVAK